MNSIPLSEREVAVTLPGAAWSSLTMAIAGLMVQTPTMPHDPAERRAVAVLLACCYKGAQLGCDPRDDALVTDLRRLAQAAFQRWGVTWGTDRDAVRARVRRVEPDAIGGEG